MSSSKYFKDSEIGLAIKRPGYDEKPKFNPPIFSPNNPDCKNAEPVDRDQPKQIVRIDVMKIKYPKDHKLVKMAEELSSTEKKTLMKILSEYSYSPRDPFDDC